MPYSALVLFALLTLQPDSSAQAAQPVEEERPDPNEEYIPATLDADGKAVVGGLNRFGFELYGKLRDAPGDMAFSPASISTAFGLAHAAAKGPTANDIARTLHYPAVADLPASFGAVLRTMEIDRNGRKLTVNNALWLQDEMPIAAGFQQLVERNYGAGIQRINFRGDPDAARLKINAWVESKTNGKIRNLLHREDVTANTRTQLVNTVYFKADWLDPFDKVATRPEDFTLASGTAIKRDLMHQRGSYAFAEEAELKVIAMPYRGGETEMLVLLPGRPNGLARVERSLDSEMLDRLDAKMKRAKVDLALPKFKIESRFQFVEPLKELGMKAPFSDLADFSGMVDGSGQGGLVIGEVVHQIFVEVEEKGTEAAAATAIGLVLTSARIEPLREFRADHPFLFLIRDRRTKSILFVGRFTGEKSG